MILTQRQISASVGRNAVNRLADVLLVQKLLNQHIHSLIPLRPLREDGQIGPQTISAIVEFQKRVVLMGNPDGRVDPGGGTLRALLDAKTLAAPKAPGSTTEPSWMQIARKEIGTKALPGHEKNSPKILEYLGTFPYLKKIWGDKEHTYHLGDVDETAWCACFVNWCLIKAGKAAGPSAAAIDWLKYGVSLEKPQIGAITVVHHTPGKSTSGTTSSGNHVAFYAGGDGAHIKLLGGNQGHAVNEKTFSGWTIKGYRWPK